MGPCVTGDLMAVASHAADQTGPWSVTIVDGAFAKVATRDEECCLDVVALQLSDKYL